MSVAIYCTDRDRKLFSGHHVALKSLICEGSLLPATTGVSGAIVHKEWIAPWTSAMAAGLSNKAFPLSG